MVHINVLYKDDLKELKITLKEKTCHMFQGLFKTFGGVDRFVDFNNV